jgi:hypothetical protein
MTNREVAARDILSTLPDLWARMGRADPFPQMSLQTVRRTLSHWEWSRRRAHKKRRPVVNPEDAFAFVWRILRLAAQGGNSRGIGNGDGSAFLPYPLGYYTRARRGSDSVQNQMLGNDEQSYTVMLAVALDGLKLSSFTIIKGKTMRSEWGLDLGPGRLDAVPHTAMGWQPMGTMPQWLRFLPSPPEYADMHGIHVTIYCYPAHHCDNVRARADELGTRLHFIPPQRTDILQPWDRAVFRALKAEYQAIDRYEMSQREDKSMTKAIFAAYRLLAWEMVSEEAIHRGRECYRPDTEVLERELAAALTE